MTFTAASEPAMPAALSDETLVSRLRDGDASAGDELVRRYAHAIVRYLHRLVGDAHLAEELHQQTWLSALDHLDRFNAGPETGGFKAWLFRIATNKANDHWRGLSRGRTLRRNLLGIVPDTAPDAAQGPALSEETAKLQRMVEQLPPQYRQVLLLRFYSGLKFVEIARLLGCPLNTALGRMHKALGRLRELMGAKDDI